MRRFLGLALLICGLLRPGAGLAADLSRGLAIADPLALRELDLREQRDDGSTHPGFGLRQMLDPESSAPLHNERLFALPSMAALRASLDDEFARYQQDHWGRAPKLFDRDRLAAGTTRFVLAGIVNRMDRGFVAADGCGEIRLIYRPIDDAAGGRRLPMTLNIVLRARGAEPGIACREIARRWLATGEWPDKGADLARRLVAADGPLAPLGPAAIDRIEVNLQIATMPAATGGDFRADYLMQVFRFDAVSQRYQAAPMENQIDRDRLLADRDLGSQFKRWLLQPENVVAFDRGTLIVPETYLARRAIAATPAAFTDSELRPAFGLAGPGPQAPLFSDADIVAALQRAADSGGALQTVRSPAGFARRLNDITCSGCHQTQAIGGFHFPGAEWGGDQATSTVAPGSPHFVGDQLRRRDIVMALRDGRQPDYSRGFTDRPQLRGATALDGTAEMDGWGAACGLADPHGTVDPSFRNWRCAAGLSCQPARGAAAFPIGMCFVGHR
ncbi:conserved hypothetical protein [Rhodopseudomonas palustris HaA2]|uniref:Uncharacterized protein n=1 Tax=Rhodopseudomonas palustris (strain HaA2) TaxID=316058 RepID=Q2IT19_RHOP2|nr:hypothetical protein [Rhodopseudomonas palustris]ABD08641.1 conserved hypothetical protein [Rhodopseudomonas palustris HaA2]